MDFQEKYSSLTGKYCNYCVHKLETYHEGSVTNLMNSEGYVFVEIDHEILIYECYLDIFLDGTFVKRQQTMDKIKIRSQNIIEKCNKIIECMNIMETE